MATRSLLPTGGRLSGESFDFGVHVAREMERADENVALAKRPLREYVELVPEPNIGLLRIEDDFPFQQAWYEPDVVDAEEVVMEKSTQIGASAHWWRWAVRRTDQFGETGVYIFPTDTHVTEFGDERIEPSIDESDYLRSRIPRGYVRHKRLKRIGRGFLHLRGSNSKAGAQSVAAQFIVFDEYDFLDQNNLPQIERRITGARQLGLTPRIRRLGTPTLEGFGIDQAFQDSDQRVWLVECRECHHEQQVTWEENVRWTNTPRGREMRPGDDTFVDPKHVERVWRCCQACEADLDVKKGRWKAQQPGRKVIGFHVPRLIVPYTDLKQIVIASRSTKPMDVEAFENNDLGRGYSASESQLSASDLAKACSLGTAMQYGRMSGNPHTAGLDVAGERALNLIVHEQLAPEYPGIPNPRRAVYIGKPKDFEEALRICKAFGCVSIVVDSNPERRMAKAFRASFPVGTVVLCVYDDKNESDPIKLSEVGTKGTPFEGVPLKITVNRTEAIDAMMDGIRQQRNRPLAEPPAGYLDQMRSLKRRTVLDTKGRPKREYITTGTLGDDYGHAEVYALMATEMWRMGGGVAVIAEQQEGRNLPDEEFGFKRVRLRGDDDVQGGGIK